jgi:hypothetical protein
MRLTDNEKREILKLIEAEKPLPDKYHLRDIHFPEFEGEKLI